MLEAALDEGRGWAHAAAAIRIPAWLSALERHREARPELVAGISSGFGISRGVSGDVRMVDAARACHSCAPQRGHGHGTPRIQKLPPWVRKAVGRFSDWGAMVDAQIALLTGQLSRLRSYLPRGTNPAIPSPRSAMRSPRPSRRDTRRMSGSGSSR